MSTYTTHDSSEFLNQAESLIPAEVRMFSGCEDEQTSADVGNLKSSVEGLPNPAGRSGGACTSALLEILYQNNDRVVNHQLSFQELLLSLRESLSKKGFSQIPQLTSSRPLEVGETPFHLVGSGDGARRALLVGINYQGQNGELRGCHNDVLNVKKYIQEVHGFPEKDVMVLMDDDNDGDGNYYPTREKVVLALKSLVANSAPGDSVFFHYSGHGGLLEPVGNPYKIQSKNTEFDETLIPVDYKDAGQIRDFSLYNDFVQPMLAGVTVTCLIDCCHSGSVLDLPYRFRPTSTGEIDRQENFDGLSNLALLFTLAGGVLPEGIFDGVVQHINTIIGGNLLDFHGIGLLGDNFMISPEKVEQFLDFWNEHRGDTGAIIGVATTVASAAMGAVQNQQIKSIGSNHEYGSFSDQNRGLDDEDGNYGGREDDASNDNDGNFNCLLCICQFLSNLLAAFLQSEEEDGSEFKEESEEYERAPLAGAGYYNGGGGGGGTALGGGYYNSVGGGSGGGDGYYNGGEDDGISSGGGGDDEDDYFG